MIATTTISTRREPPFAVLNNSDCDASDAPSYHEVEQPSHGPAADNRIDELAVSETHPASVGETAVAQNHLSLRFARRRRLRKLRGKILVSASVAFGISSFAFACGLLPFWTACLVLAVSWFSHCVAYRASRAGIAICVLAIPSIFLCSLASTQAQTLTQVLDSLESSYPKESQQCRKQLTKFDESDYRAKETLRKSLQHLKAQAGLNSNPLGAADLHRQIADVEDWLRQGGDLPKSDFLLPQICLYVQQLYDAKVKLDRGLVSLIAKLRKDGKIQDASSLQKAAIDACSILDSSQVIEQGKSFGGNRWNAKSTEPTRIDLKIETVMGNNFSGKIERDTGISMHPVHGMSGVVNGLNIMIDTQGPRDPGRKKDGDWTYSGILIGRTIIGTFIGRGAKGKLSGGTFRLDQR